MRRFRQRQRRLSEADLLILARDHWNFDVKGFNPGGNHGSFFRVSTNATLMFAGGSTTGIPRGAVVAEPYDSEAIAAVVLQRHAERRRRRGTRDVLFELTRASCAWLESERDSRISEILIQPVGWAEASRRCRSLIRKTCVTG